MRISHEVYFKERICEQKVRFRCYDCNKSPYLEKRYIDTSYLIAYKLKMGKIMGHAPVFIANDLKKLQYKSRLRKND